MSLHEKIRSTRYSVVAIGEFQPQNRVNILGSGFAVDTNGTIVTAAHLFMGMDSARQGNIAAMVMEREDGKLANYKWLPARILAENPQEDSAVLRVDPSNTLLKPAELGDPASVEEGQDVYFMGFPYAVNLINEGFGVTLITNRGIISSVKFKAADQHPLDWFVVDAISNPGNSGCPLFDVSTNKVIGLMSIAFRIQSKNQPTLDIREPMHIAGAKPISSAKELLATLP